MAVAASGGFHAVWFGMRQDVAAARYGRLSEQGSPQGPVRVLPDDMAEHADVTTSGKRVAIVWRSFDGERTRLRAWLSVDDGANFTLRELLATNQDNDHPRLASHGADRYVVWRTEREIHVRKIVW